MTDQMIRQKLNSDPSLAKLQAWVLANVGAANRRLGKFQDSLNSYHESIALHEKVSGEKSAEMFDALHGLGHTYLEAGDPVKAEEYYTRAVNYLVANPTLIDQIYETANLEMIARLYRDIGRYAEAEPYFKRVLAAKQSQGDELETLKEVAQFYAMQNNYYEAQKYMLQAAELEEKEILRGGEERQLALRELAETYSELGEIYANQDLEVPAEDAFHLSQALQNAELSKRRVNVLLRTPGSSKEEITAKRKENAAHLEKCADLFLKLNRIAAAESAYLLALGLRVLTNDQSLEAREHMAAIQIKLGNFYRYSRKNFAEAEKRYQAALTALSNVHASQTTLDGEALTQLGSLYAFDLKKPAEGEKLLKDALTSVMDARDSEGVTIRALTQLAVLYLNQSRFKETVDIARRRLDVTHALLKRMSAKVTGSDKWNAEDYTHAFDAYVTAVFNLEVAHRASGDAQSAQAVASSLLDPELRISDVIDPKILGEYGDMLVRHRQLLPPAVAENLETHLEAIAVRQKYIEAVLKDAD
jgi:tetratricopeptide (TPR) repeat protein